jgi:transposase
VQFLVHQTRPLTEEDIQALEAVEPGIKGRREHRRFLSVYYRAKEGLSAEIIALRLGIHKRTVEKHHQRYFKEGITAFNPKTTGSQEPRLLSQNDEATLFESLKTEAMTGQFINASVIKSRFEEKAGQSCATSTIYVVIRRNNWSKKQPRPRHPKGDDEAKSLFKKTC